MHKKKARLIVIKILLFVLIINLLCCSISYIKIGTCNYFRVAIGLAYIQSGNADYVVVRDQPNQIILSSPKDSEKIFNEYLDSEGYTEGERLGALRVISKDEQDEQVYFSVNGYYSKWIWDIK